MRQVVELTQSQPTPTAVVCGQVRPQQLAQFVPAACGEVWTFARAAGLPKPGRHVAVYFPDGTVEAGAEVTAPFTGNDRVHCSHLPAGRAATTTHHGPYGGLGAAHTAVRRWCAEHGHRLSGISWEIYGHWEEGWNADPSQIRTDVFHLLEEDGGGMTD
ncbi:MAG: GyrI-like domain-containing protein [Prosthecobacter sp.]